ncbi:hypothetical protein BD413DRAFT_508224 [Trametes elegans]|nr:hypothetical protein BD413DRAFT_508224 [Trametes elegans]
MVSYSILQQSIREEIGRADFDAALPPLSDKTWMKILTLSPQAHAENERLEFLGDALMYATIGRQLYAQVPDGSPHLYTCVRAALHSNATFAMLAEKLDIMAVSSTVLQALTRKTFGEGTAAPAKSRPQIKATADLFETVIGAYYLDHGFEALYQWVKVIYTPLIKAVTNTFYAHRSRPPPRGGNRDLRVFPMNWRPQAKQPPPPVSKGRLLLSPVKQRKRVLEKIQAVHAMRHTPSVKTSIVGKRSLPPNPMLVPPIPRTKMVPPIPRTNASSSKLAIQAVPAIKKTPIYIDLTLSSDSDDEGVQLFRHPLVTPRIPRPSHSVSKRPTPARTPVPVPPAAAATSSGSHSESEDETMLENMLTVDTFSDMDWELSDDESPARTPIFTAFQLKLHGSPVGGALNAGMSSNQGVKGIRSVLHG